PCSLRSACFSCSAGSAELFTLSLHDALPICSGIVVGQLRDDPPAPAAPESRVAAASADLRFLRREAPPGTTVVDVAGTVPATLTDRKSTRLNSSHVKSSYAVFCLNKKDHTLQ